MDLTKSPYRVCAVNNNFIGRNEIMMDLVPENIEDYFGDIINNTELLDSTYVEERYSCDQHSAMHRDHPGEFLDNAASEYDPRAGHWRRSRPNPLLQRAYADIIKDKIELTLLTVLDRIVRTQRRILNPGGFAVTPLNNMVFLQGGIGSGKTTMLHHFHSVLIPKLEAQKPLPVQFCFALIDFNNIDIDESAEKSKNEVTHAVRLAIENDARLNSVDAWETLAHPEIYDEKGNVRPAIATSLNPEEEKRRIIHLAEDSSIFLQRATRYLATLPRPCIPVFVYDNLDFQPVLRQLQFVRHLQNILAKNRSALGVVSVRERTLGHLCQLGAFRAFGHLKKMHMTTPMLPILIQKRFDKLLASWKPSDKCPTIQIAKRSFLSEYNLHDIIAHISSAFVPRYKLTKVSSRIRDSLGRESLDTFLHNATNSNARKAVSLVVEALQSWALRYERPITEFVINRDVDRKQSLPPMGVDELLRLSAVGQWKLYDHEQNEFIQNVFAWGSHMPNAAEGRFPVLFVYRMLQFFESHDDHIPKRDIYNQFRWIGYSQHEISDLLKYLIDRGFLESYEGPKLDRITILYKTRKTWFYYHFLSKMFVYLENMRNDSMIEYSASPHEFNCDVQTDAHAVFMFIEYILDQEEREYAYIKKEKRNLLNHYKEVVADQPVSWKLLRSVVRRLNDIADFNPKMFPPVDHSRLAKKCRYMKAIILDKAEQGKIWPPNCPGRNDVIILPNKTVSAVSYQEA